MRIEDLLAILRYDPETGEFHWLRRAHGRRRDLRATSKNGRGYLHVLIGGKCWLAHQLAWFFVTGKMPQDDMDHINGVRTDNRIENLREATRSQNCANQKSRPRTRQLLKGVHPARLGGKWYARVKYKQKVIHLGTFETEEDAHIAYCTKARELWGEFARVE